MYLVWISRYHQISVLLTNYNSSWRIKLVMTNFNSSTSSILWEIGSGVVGSIWNYNQSNSNRISDTLSAAKHFPTPTKRRDTTISFFLLQEEDLKVILIENTAERMNITVTDEAKNEIVVSRCLVGVRKCFAALRVSEIRFLFDWW